jgi:hypothetical protein
LTPPLLQTGSFPNTVFQEGFADYGVFYIQLVAGIFLWPHSLRKRKSCGQQHRNKKEEKKKTRQMATKSKAAEVKAYFFYSPLLFPDFFRIITFIKQA